MGWSKTFGSDWVGWHRGCGCGRGCRCAACWWSKVYRMYNSWAGYMSRGREGEQGDALKCARACVSMTAPLRFGWNCESMSDMM